MPINIPAYLVSEPIVTMQMVGNGFRFSVKIRDNVLNNKHAANQRHCPLLQSPIPQSRSRILFPGRLLDADVTFMERVPRMLTTTVPWS